MMKKKYVPVLYSTLHRAHIKPLNTFVTSSCFQHQSVMFIFCCIKHYGAHVIKFVVELDISLNLISNMLT